MKIIKPEILAPANNLEVLKTAFNFGADAVYIGGEMYSLRAKAKNFSKDDIREGIQYGHNIGKKVYITANITAHNRDLSDMEQYFEECRLLRPDALIISDPGVFLIAGKVCPDIDIHISTQANNVNYLTFDFWRAQGAKRVVTARELMLSEIKEIKNHVKNTIEIEAFVHGSMCISYSGRCLLSNYFTGRDANLGECTHPCRWKYYVTEEKRPGEYLPIEENVRGTYLFNSKDLCMIEYIPELIDAGIDSFKIEGRMKTALYVATTVRAYRQAIDDYVKDPEKYRKNIPFYKEEVSKCTYRQYSTGFYLGPVTHESQIYDSSTYIKEYALLGIVEEVSEQGALFEQKNKFSVGDEVEIMKTSGENIMAIVKGLKTEEGEAAVSCPHPKKKLWLEIKEKINRGDIIRAPMKTSTKAQK